MMTNNPSDILSLIDVLDIDENVIDQRLSVLINRESYDTKHLFNASVLLKYKLLINEAESEDCDNEVEYNFLFKLIHQASDENVDMVCKITKLILLLNKTFLTSKVQHLLQQLLPYISDFNEQNGDSEVDSKTTLIYLRLCDCLFDILIENTETVTLPVVSASFVNTMSSSETVIKYFLLNTVPRIVAVLPEVHVLENIWHYIINMKQEVWLKALKYLTTLADLYFSPNKMILVDQPQFWDLILQGLYSSTIDHRKSSMYLIKRSLEQLALKNNPHNDECKLNWKNNKNYFKDFITLFECLEEQQSIIVIPALHILDNIKGMDKVWLNSLFKLGLAHDSKQVKLKCLQEYFKHCVITPYEADLLLNSINDMSLFSCASEVDTILNNYKEMDTRSLFIIFESIPKIVWSPIPLHYIVGATIELLNKILKSEGSIDIQPIILENRTMLYQVLNDINQMSCNIPLIRENIHHKTAELFVELCKSKNWRDLKGLKIFDPKDFPLNGRCSFEVNDITVNNGDEEEFADMLLLSPVHIIIASPFLSKSPTCIDALNKKISIKFSEIELVVNSETCIEFTKYLELIDFINVCCQYCNHIFQSQIGQIPNGDNSDILPITHSIQEKIVILIDYMHSILSHSKKISYEDGAKLCNTFKNISYIIKDCLYNDRYLHLKKSLLSLYKKCLHIANSKTGDIARTILSYKILNNLRDCLILNFPQEGLILDKISRSDALTFKLIDLNKDPSRQLSSILNHEYWVLLSKSSEDILLDLFIPNKADILTSCLDTILADAIEICDSTTLKFVLMVVEKSLTNLTSKIFDIEKLLTTIWRRINDVKSLSKEYSQCLQIFLSIIFKKTITQNESYNDLVLSYFKEILELSSNSVGTYNNLLKKVAQVTSGGINAELLAVMISELLIFSPFQRKDQIMLDRVLKSLKEEMKLKVDHTADKMDYTFDIFNSTFSKHDNLLQNILKKTIKKIDAKFFNKQRYHQGSQLHTELFNSLKLMLIIACCKNSTINDESLYWCTELLCQLPHHPEIKTCLEWYISLYFCYKELSLNASGSQIILEKLPISSKYLVFYHVLKHRLLNENYSFDEYEYVMEKLLASIMGANFNLRLQAQFLSKELFQLQPEKKYAYTIALITKALTESDEEKNYIKIKNDYFYNDFDLVQDLNFEFIYNVFPSLYSEEKNHDIKFTDMYKHFCEHVFEVNKSKFAETWLKLQSDKPNKYSNVNVKNISDKYDSTDNKEEFKGVIQKKYIPWKSMCDVDVYEADQVKNGKLGDMIVVASLVDKLPNLGGMARTSEVFAVKTLVIDSLRHVLDRQFQGLSMSAERWVNIEEVRPGQSLKEYLLKKKAEGYVIVAAEQASTSVQLQAYHFPKKCLLVLGHEKNGVPCDLLPYMDFCVEIPQHGFVRSLNVHVTAAIFIWEYTKQHLSFS